MAGACMQLAGRRAIVKIPVVSCVAGDYLGKCRRTHQQRTMLLVQPPSPHSSSRPYLLRLSESSRNDNYDMGSNESPHHQPLPSPLPSSEGCGCRKPQRAPKDWEARKVVDDAEVTCRCLSMSPPPLHLPRMQERAGGGFILFNATIASSTFSHSRARWRWILFTFQCRHHLSASLTLESETEVDSFCLSMLAPPLYLPRTQERAGGGLLSMLDAGITSPPHHLLCGHRCACMSKSKQEDAAEAPSNDYDDADTR
ncbi:hypothetical protein BDZ97DRAFT_1765694 [Flammula alnicola]|nr:hypothetical protein BDZ97DRAFT_1765694 [Flammula alnicola]